MAALSMARLSAGVAGVAAPGLAVGGVALAARARAAAGEDAHRAAALHAGRGRGRGRLQPQVAAVGHLHRAAVAAAAAVAPAEGLLARVAALAPDRGGVEVEDEAAAIPEAGGRVVAGMRREAGLLERGVGRVDQGDLAAGAARARVVIVVGALAAAQPQGQRGELPAGREVVQDLVVGQRVDAGGFRIAVGAARGGRTGVEHLRARHRTVGGERTALRAQGRRVAVGELLGGGAARAQPQGRNAARAEQGGAKRRTRAGGARGDDTNGHGCFPKRCISRMAAIRPPRISSPRTTRRG